MRAAKKGEPLLARLDGRAFHTFTKGLNRPYDQRLSSLMIKTTAHVMHELGARIGYTQSDEITLAWFYPDNSASDYPFSGRFQKLCSILSSSATAFFVSKLKEIIPEKAHLYPQFDCRVWQTSINDAVFTFKWREADARKNAVSMAASSVFPHKQLQGVPSSERLRMLEEAGIDWKSMPTFFKYGTYVNRQNIDVRLTDEELARIPADKVPADRFVTRSYVGPISGFASVNDLDNPEGFLLHSEQPKVKPGKRLHGAEPFTSDDV